MFKENDINKAGTTSGACFVQELSGLVIMITNYFYCLSQNAGGSIPNERK
jgi:hypothetical protein